MLNCWHHEPRSRPTFEQLAFNFKMIVESLGVKVQVGGYTCIYEHGMIVSSGVRIKSVNNYHNLFQDTAFSSDSGQTFNNPDYLPWNIVTITANNKTKVQNDYEYENSYK